VWGEKIAIACPDYYVQIPQLIKRRRADHFGLLIVFE